MKKVTSIEDVIIDDQLAILGSAKTLSRSGIVSNMMILSITDRGLITWSTRMSLLEKLGTLTLAIQEMETGSHRDVPDADPEDSVS